MSGESFLTGDPDDSAHSRISRRKFLVAAGGATALFLTPGLLDAAALAHEPLENMMLAEGEVLLGAVTHQGHLWTLLQTPAGVNLRQPSGNDSPFPAGFTAESLGKFGNQIVAGGHRISPLHQKFDEGNYATLVGLAGLSGLAAQPGLDRWPTGGTRDYQTNELVPAYVTLRNGNWSAPIDVPNLGDVAGSVTSVIGGANSLELVVDSLLDASVRDSAVEILQVSVSSRSGRSDRNHVADTAHGNSTVLGQDDNKAYVLATSLDGNQIVEVGSDATPRPVELGTEITPLSVSIKNGKAELFVEGDNGDIGSIPLKEASRRDGDIEDHLQDEKLGKRSFGEDVVLAYELEGAHS